MIQKQEEAVALSNDSLFFCKNKSEAPQGHAFSVKYKYAKTELS